MSSPDCTDVCEIIISQLKALGFKISNNEDHTDVINALNKCSLIKDIGGDSKHIIEIDVEQFMQDNFEGEIPKNKKMTEQCAKEFKEHLEESLSAWITDEWSIYKKNRGD